MMSSSSLLNDAQIRPDLFNWNGCMDSISLQTWLDQNQWLGRCPADLIAFWKETGGGDIFETETLLGPLGDQQLGDDIVTVNREFRSRGMPDRFVVFHQGLLISAADTISEDYVELDSSNFRVLQRFVSLDAWYIATLREEYRQRYKLP